MKFDPHFKSLFEPKRYRVYYGGRGSGKSTSVAMALMARGAKQRERILCCREFQSSIADSVHLLLSDINDKYNLGYNVIEKTLRHPNGTTIVFEGLHRNSSKIKSMEGFTICYIEEANTVQEQSFQDLTPTIRRDDSEIILVFNPHKESDYVYKRFILPYSKQLSETGKYEDEFHLIQKVNYLDNSWCPKVLKDEAELMMEMDMQKYRHVYLGEIETETGSNFIKQEWVEAAIDAHIKLPYWSYDGQKVVGFDPSDGGVDPQGLIYREATLVKGIYKFEGLLEEGCKLAWDIAEEKRATDIVFDGVGLGKGAKILFDQKDTHNRVVRTTFVGNQKPDFPMTKYKGDIKNKDVFRNKRAQYYQLLSDRFYKTWRAVAHGIHCDPSEMISIESTCDHLDDLKEELTQIRLSSKTGNSLVQIESKVDQRSRGVKSPNMADALVYAFAAPCPKVEKYKEIRYKSEW